MTFFLVIDLFRVLYMVFFHRGAKSAADIDTGGQNSYFSTKSQYFHCSFWPGGGPKLHCQFRWGAMAGFAPLDPPLTKTRHYRHTGALKNRSYRRSMPPHTVAKFLMLLLLMFICHLGRQSEFKAWVMNVSLQR